MTLIQRFGSALNLNIHFHTLCLDGAYVLDARPPVFRWIAPPREAELQVLVQRVAQRIGRALERAGLRSKPTKDRLAAGRSAGNASED